MEIDAVQCTPEPDLIVIITLLNLRYKLLGGRRVFITRERWQTEELYITLTSPQVRREEGGRQGWPSANWERREESSEAVVVCLVRRQTERLR